MWVPSLGWHDPLEEGTTTHSSILAWRIPWTEEPGGLRSILRLYQAVVAKCGYIFTLKYHIMVVKTLTNELTHIKPS